MNADAAQKLLWQAVHESGVSPAADGFMQMTECQLYDTIRQLMHRLDREAGMLDVKRYGYKAVAGVMRELRERRGCT